jgi:Na+-transporting methylmalonyl-CoA/oxaloacetate decarboxylase gamma subunit
MIDLIKQSLILTGWGMGMTFLAIGALMVGMYTMTLLVKEKRDLLDEDKVDDSSFDFAGEDSTQYPETDRINIKEHVPNRGEKYRAVAASVAVAIAIADETGKSQEASSLTQIPSIWDFYVRGRYLSQRTIYESQKKRHQQVS